MLLTYEETEFLRRNSLSINDVFDGTGLRASEAKRQARAQGKQLFVGAKCATAGHRLRTRSGHCAQCNSASIAFQRRHRETQWLYLAWSPNGNLFKVGASLKPRQRMKILNEQRYGRESDWLLVAAAFAPEVGTIEQEIQRKFSEFQVFTDYQKQGSQIAIELFEVHKDDYLEFFDGIREIVRQHGPTRQFSHPAIGHYKFDFGASEDVDLS